MASVGEPPDAAHFVRAVTLAAMGLDATKRELYYSAGAGKVRKIIHTTFFVLAAVQKYLDTCATSLRSFPGKLSSLLS